MSATTILALDQGTTNSKALLVDASGAIVAEAARPVPCHYPQPAWVEQDPLDLWESARDAALACLRQAGDARPVALAVTNQRESVLAWERATGRPLGPCISWQCRRTAPFCEELRVRGLEPLLRARTGLTVDPLFSASKARRLLAMIPDGAARAASGEICLGTVDSWLLWNLTGGAVHACDATNAARTQLYDIHRGAWDPELLELFGVPAAALPRVHPSSGLFGETAHGGALPAGIPIAAVIGDSHGALFGQAGFAPGAVKATYGTGSSLMTPTPGLVESAHGLSTTIAWARDTVTYALEGNISVTGAAVQWLGECLGRPDPARAVADLAASVADSGGVYFVPAFVGLGAPYWREDARGLFSGLTRGTGAAHLARAAVEAIAYQVRDVFDVMAAEAGTPLDCLLADGGASANDALMQFQADILGRAVHRTAVTDASALGAAYLAGLAIGLWDSETAIARLPRTRTTFEPRMAPKMRDARYAGWRTAVARATYVPSGEPAEVA